MSQSNEPQVKKQVKLNRRLCDKAMNAQLRYELARAVAELELWRRGLQHNIQAAKVERNALLTDLAVKAGIDPDRCEFDLDAGIATEKQEKT